MSPVNQNELVEFCANFPTLTICNQDEIVSDQQLLRLLKSYLQQDNLIQQVLTIVALIVVIVCCVSVIWCICEFWRFVQRSRPHVPEETGCCTRYWVFVLHKLSACCVCLFCQGPVMDMGHHVENQ